MQFGVRKVRTHMAVRMTIHMQVDINSCHIHDYGAVSSHCMQYTQVL